MRTLNLRERGLRKSLRYGCIDCGQISLVYYKGGGKNLRCPRCGMSMKRIKRTKRNEVP